MKSGSQMLFLWLEKLSDFGVSKENHGRIWAFLYLSAKPVSTSSIRDTLQLSKGATSMLLNELEECNIYRVTTMQDVNGLMLQILTLLK